MKKKEIYFDFEGESTTPGPPIRPLKGHSAEWEAGAGPRIMMIINMMDWMVDGDGEDDDVEDGDDDVAGEAAVCQGQVSQHPGWKSKSAEAGLRKVDGETHFNVTQCT